MGGYVPGVPPSLADLLLVGRYRLGRLLGAGGMADVYDAMDERLGRAVAVKVLRPEMAARDDVRLRFEAEARSAASLAHPNVVSVFDTGEDGQIPFLVMERLPGETLADRMQAGPVDIDWVLQVAGDVLGALGAAHAAGIVHRDVKPGNILIAADGCAKVADFGIAKSLEVAAAADLTGTNQMVGTPAYVAPERISGHAATPQSDLYAVGVLLYEALAARKPFTGPTPVATAYAIQHETPPPLHQLRPDTPPHVVAAVERVMARDPAARFESAADVAAALRVVPSSPDATIATAMADDPTIVSSIDAGDTQVLPVSAAVDVPPPTPATPAPPLVQDRRRLWLVAAGALVLALVLLGVALASGGTSDRSALARDLRSGAAELRDSEGTDGPASAEAAAALESVADAVDGGAGGAEATAALGQVAAWRDGGQLTAAAAERISVLLRRVPGVDPTAATTPPPATEPPPPQEEGEAEEHDDRDGGGGKKKRGKGDD